MHRLVYFSTLNKIPFSIMLRFLKSAIPLPICILAACNAYNLDDKIRAVLQPGLNISAAAFSGIPYTNQGITRNLADYTTGGTPPYQFTMSLNGTLPTYLLMTINSSSFVTGRNQAIAAPATLTGLTGLPSITIKVNDSAGNTFAATYPLSMTYKRVYATKDTVNSDSSTWNNSGTNNYSNCSTGNPVDKANCRCVIAAKGANLSRPEKYRAWLSMTGIDARCNLINQQTTSCSPAANQGGPWYNTAGTLIVEDMGTASASPNYGLLNSLGTGSLMAAIQYDEYGTTGPTEVMAGTNTGGVLQTSFTCNDWTATATYSISYGTVANFNSAPYWYGGSNSACTTALRGLLCFESD